MNKSITFGDVMSVVVIIAGILIAVFLDDIAMKMIGICISILGGIALFMLISQRLSDIVDSKAIKRNKKPDFQVTTVKDDSGIRQTVENFDSEFSIKDDEFFKIKTKDSDEELKSENTEGDDKKVSKAAQIIEQKPNINTRQEEEQTKDVNFTSWNYSDSFSGMRIVGKAKITPKEQEKENNQSKNVTETKVEPKKPNIVEPVAKVKNEYKEMATSNPITYNRSTEKPADEKPKVESKPAEKPKEVITENVKSEVISQEEEKIIKTEHPQHLFFEKDVVLSNEPKIEFEYFISRILLIIRSVTDTTTSMFVLTDNRNEYFSLDAIASEKANLIEKKGKLKISNDIISQIIKNAKPEILSEINPSAIKDLIPYYSEQTKVSSFIGVPVIWNDNVIGVLCADSESPDAYDSATVAFMGHFTKLISALVKNYTHKLDLLQAAKTLEVITQYQNSIVSGSNLEHYYEILIETISLVFKDYNVGIVAYNEDKDDWEIALYKKSNEIKHHLELNLHNTLIGESIIENKVVYKSGMELINLIRATVNEPKFTSGEFLASPIRTHHGLYGGAFIESTPNENLTKFDISIFEVLCDHAANAIERLNLIKMYKTSCMIDRNTGLFNSTAFYERIAEEIERTTDHKNYPVILCLFRIDKYASLDPKKYSERYEIATMTVMEKVKKYIKKYEAFGRVDDSTYGIIFIGRDSNQVKLTAERIRNDVANNVIEFEGAKFSVTISIGLSVYNSNSGINTFISNTVSALVKSSELSNHVQMFY